MPAPTDDTVVIAADRLRAFALSICRHAGCDPEEAAAIAGHLVDANLTGHDSHGVGMLTDYVPAMREGRLKLGRRARVIRDQGAVVVLDGGIGVGQVLGREAMTVGIARARQHGVALVALQRSHHLGRIGAWAEQCAAAGCASLHYVNVIGHRTYVAPFGGRDGRLATNPVCIGLPATERPAIILDMATSKVAFGKIKVARNKGRPAPEGALLDPAGEPTTDPTVMFGQPIGALLPFGEHKGYGLALMCDLLAGALAGGGTNRPETQVSDTIINSMLSIVIDPGALTNAAGWKAEADATG
jgi:hydroxycarboxylate dehydrogenase B